MADDRIRQPVKIVDPTTDAREAGVDANGHLQVTGNTGANAIEIQGTVAEGSAVANNPLLVAGDDGTNVRHVLVDAAGHLQVDVLTGGGSDTPTNPVTTTNTNSAVAAGSSVNQDGPSRDGTTKKVSGFTASASVPIKAELIQVDNDVETIKVVLFGKAGDPISYKPPHRDFLSRTFGSTGGFDGWRVKVTNLDNTQAADLYSTLFEED